MKKIKMGMVGGGAGSFIGKVHLMAASLDNRIELVCGAFSKDPQKSVKSGIEYGLPEERIYLNFTEMIEKESRLPDDKRMEILSIVTPNNVHFEPVRLALEKGFHVVCDKPLAFSLKEAVEIKNTIQQTGKLLAVTYTYTGYPMIKEARYIIQSGRLGKIRKILVEYPQGWLAEAIEKAGNKQAQWRTDPLQAGKSCTIGDIGIHAANLAEYVSGLTISHICADVTTFVPGRLLDDDGSILLRFDGGAKGVLTASQICSGEENALKIQVYGEKGGIEWHQMEPNSLILKWPNRPKEVLRTGSSYVSKSASAHTRLPAGHPEGYIEAFANIYRNFALTLICLKEGKPADPLFDFPSIEEGLRGMLFIEKVIESSQCVDKWVKM
jgi:predicted dehydrogenase